MVRSGWDVDEDGDDDNSDAVSRYHRAAQATSCATEEIVQRWTALGKGNALVDHIRAAMNTEAMTSDRFSSPHNLLLHLFTEAPQVARSVLRRYQGPDAVDDVIMHAALICLFGKEDPEAEAAANIQIAAGAVPAAMVASAAMNSRAPLNPMIERVVRRLLGTDIPEVHLSLLSAARWMDSADRGLVLEMLQSAPIETGIGVADAAAGVLAGGDNLLWASLPPEERKTFLGFLR
jgi:hypothetical protein